MNEQEPTRVRASDPEREQVAERVRQAMSEGRLTLTEGEQRLAEVYATTYRDELPRLTADLPPEPPPDPSPGARRGPAGADGAGRRFRPRPAIGLAVVGAVAAGIWVVAGSGPLWLAIVLGVVAVMLAKHSRFGHHPHGYGPGPGRHCGRGETT